MLDLRSANRATAEASLKEMIERSRFAKGKTVAVRLDPPPEGGGETLFQPAGRLLLDAKRRGLVDRLHTLPAQDGLIVEQKTTYNIARVGNGDLTQTMMLLGNDRMKTKTEGWIT